MPYGRIGKMHWLLPPDEVPQMELLERHDVLHDLSALATRARHGDGHVVLLRGEAGIGKTVVATALARDVTGDCRVLWGSCDDLLVPRSWGPVRDMAPREPDLAEALAAESPRLVRQGLLDAFTRTYRPTVAVFEDVHWADGATLDLLTLIGRRIARTRTLLVMTFRDVSSDHPLSVVLGDLPATSVRSIRLEPLSRGAVVRLAGGREATAAQAYEVTGGNPFLVSAVLADTGDGVPDSISDLVGSLLGRLTGKAERLAQLVSVVPGRTELDLLDAIDPDLAPSFGDAEQVGLLRIDDWSVAFRHEIARTATEMRLTESLRRRLHRRVLRAAEQLGYDTARLAHHARHAMEVDAMVRLLPTAAREAAAARNHREAITHLEALEAHLHLLPIAERADLLELWAAEEEFVDHGGMRHAQAAVDLRRQLGDAAGLGAALICASRSAWGGNAFTRAAELAREAVDVLENVGGEHLALAYAQLARTAMQNFDPELALDHCARALALAPEPSRARALALSMAGVEKNLTSYPDGTQMLEEAAGIAASLGFAWELQRARGNLIQTALDAKDIDRARQLNDTALTSVDGEVVTTMWHVNLSAEIDTAAGDYESAERTLRELTGRTRLTGSTRWFAEGALARVLVRRGDPAAGASVRRLEDRARAVGQVQDRAWFSTVVAEYLWVFERRDDAATRRGLEVFEATLERAAPWYVAGHALWLWLDGHLDEIPAVAAEPVRWLSDGQWLRAAEWFADRGVPFEQAVALRLGDTDARLEALRIAQRIGARALAARLRRELRADGVTGIPRGPGRATRNNALGLTARQSEVLDLLAAGLSNADIADRLFLSVRTVEKHVSAILTTLGVDSRHEAANVATGGGAR
jgi:DNA-binding CsgD family transcriptional regulator